jgi:hypothetical protein
MIGVVVKAGLCNQLFMLFACISYAIDNSIDYFIHPTLIAKNYFGNFFKPIESKVIYNKDILENKYKYDESTFHHNNIPIKNEIVIEGFFQTDKYFKHNYESLLKLFKIRERQEELQVKYNLKKIIAIHFRIGDYYNLQYYHPILDVNYYINAIEYLKTQIDINKYLIVPFYNKIDEIVVNNYIDIINKNNNYNFIKSESLEDYDELILMSLCDHFIIANSTFSWFGAYFSNNPNKIVCYPSKWFGEGHKNNNTVDLFPDGWVKINNT